MLHLAVVFVRLYENCGTQENATTPRLWHLLLICAVRHSLALCTEVCSAIKKMEERYCACQMLMLKDQTPAWLSQTPAGHLPYQPLVSERQGAWQSPDSPFDEVHLAPRLRVHSSGSSRAPGSQEIMCQDADLLVPPSLATLCHWKGERDGDSAR